ARGPRVLDLFDSHRDAAVLARFRVVGALGTIGTAPDLASTDATGCPGQTAPVRPSLCLGSKDTWGGQNWSVSSALVERRLIVPRGMMAAGWLPTDAFSQHWKSFVTSPQHSVTMPQ